MTLSLSAQGKEASRSRLHWRKLDGRPQSSNVLTLAALASIPDVLQPRPWSPARALHISRGVRRITAFTVEEWSSTCQKFGHANKRLSTVSETAARRPSKKLKASFS